jgi:orotate phosphoribosyltransferase
MNSDQVIQLFKDTGALLEGHFPYASGRHGRQFMQAARLLQYAERTDTLCKAMADRFRDAMIDVVVGPATGGIALAYATAHHLKCRFAYSEKDGQGGMAVKRGFVNPKDCRILVVEDVITTGGSVQKTIDHLRERGAEIVGVSVLADRSGGEAHFDCPFEPLATITMQSWAPESCELCAQGIPITEPDDIVL